MRSARSSGASDRPRGGSASSSSATSTRSAPRARSPTPRRPRSSTPHSPRPGCPRSRSRSTTARSSTASSNRQGLSGLSGPCSAHSTSSPRSVVKRSIASFRRPADQGGPGLTEDQARKVLDYAETGRGAPRSCSMPRPRSGPIRPSPLGIANLRTVLDLLEAAGVPASGSPSTWAWPVASTITPGSSSRRPSTAGRSSAASPRGAATTTWRACSRRGGCRASGPRSGWTGSSP